MAVPAEMSVFKAVDLLQNQPAAFQMAEDMPSGGSADVNGQVIISRRYPS